MYIYSDPTIRLLKFYLKSTIAHMWNEPIYKNVHCCVHVNPKGWENINVEKRMNTNNEITERECKRTIPFETA